MIDTEAIYENYARRFLEIGNPKQAAQDVGVPIDTVNEFLANCKQHPDVQRILMEDELSMPDFNDPDSVKKHILKRLWREANYKGTGAQQAARISALKTIGEITGVEAAKKIDLNAPGGTGGMLMVPVVDTAQWENDAEEMQRKLKETARE